MNRLRDHGLQTRLSIEGTRLADCRRPKARSYFVRKERDQPLEPKKDWCWSRAGPP